MTLLGILREIRISRFFSNFSPICGKNHGREVASARCIETGNA